MVGSRRNVEDSVLRKVNACKEITKQLDEKRQRLDECEKQLKEARENGEQRRRLNQQYQTKRREVDLTRDKLEQTSQHQLIREIRRIENEIGE